VSGTGKLPFFVTGLGTYNCAKGSKLGVSFVGSQIISSEAVFYPCDTLPIRIDTSAPGFFPLGQRGGTYDLQFFIKNEFGALNSSSASDNSDKRSVFIDYGAVSNPTAQPISFGIDFGFVSKGTASPTAESPTNFGFGTVIRPSNLQNFVVRFASPSFCRHQAPTTQDGQDGSGIGASIDSFYITGSAIEGEDSEVYRKCGTDFQLNTQSIKFPASISSPATFSLRIRDYAGNPSAYYSFDIPPCGGDGGQVFCWSP
jgi:hypothetical protein